MQTQLIAPIKDKATVRPDGTSLADMIRGVVLRPARTIPDERGSVTEMYSQAWNLDAFDLRFAYMVKLRPQMIKGWVIHRAQQDRLFLISGSLKWVLFDDRSDSDSYRQVREIFITDENRQLMLIPPGVYHAVQNVGQHDAIFVNMPSAPYNHADPDKYRLPIGNDYIPYQFNSKPGW